MAVFLEVIDAGGNVTRLPVQNGRIDVTAQEGTIYRIVDEYGAAIGDGPRVLRIDDDLVITDLPAGEVIGLTEFFSACTPATPCTLSLAELGGASGETVTPASEPVAALQEGGFLMNRGHENPETLPVEPSSTGIGWKPIAAGIGGVVLLAAAAGGGGGGGGGDSDAPQSPTLTTTVVNSNTPTLAGEAEPNSRVTVTINLGGTGEQVRYDTTADANGNWQVNLAQDTPVLGTFPAAGLPDNATSTITLAAVDSAGNQGEASAALPVTIDKTGPDLVISDDVTATNATGPVTFTFDFGEPVTGFTAAEIIVTGGTAGAFASNPDGSSYTLVVTSDVVATGSINVAVAAGAALDAAGNGSTADSHAQAFVNDVTAPTLTISDNVASGSASGPVTFTFDFGEPVTDFTAADIVVSGGTAGAFASNPAGSIYTLIVTPPGTGASGTVGVSVAAGAAQDASGNLSTADSHTQAYVNDVTAPVLTISDNVAATNATGPVTFTFTFSEAVTGFTLADIDITGGTAGTLNSNAAGSVYTLVITPTAGAPGTIEVEVDAGAAQDASGNLSTADSHTQAYVNDVTDPVLTISDNVTAANATGPVTFTFTFTEPVTGFTLADIDITGGTAGTLSSNAAGSVYTLVITPTADTSGSIVVEVDANAATDAAGNPSTADTHSQAYVDATDPALTITDAITGTATGPVTYTFDFSEPVVDFDATDITIINGTGGVLTGSGDTYTMVVTPDDEFDGNMVVSVAANEAEDAAGNGNTAATNIQAVDTTSAVTVSPGTISTQDLLTANDVDFLASNPLDTAIADTAAMSYTNTLLPYESGNTLI